MSRSKKRTLGALSCVVTGLLLVTAGVGSAYQVTRPNVVLIIADDQGFEDFGFMGSQQVRTPNLDKLAAGGTLFRNGHSTASLCRPALRSLLTGFHPWQWKVRMSNLRKSRMTPKSNLQIQSFETLPGMLQKVGYRSFQGGKIFARDHKIAGFTQGVPISVTDEGTFGEAVKIGRATMQPVYDFIDEFGKEPFFLWFAPMLPHVPHNTKGPIAKHYEGKGYSASAAAYYASVERFDDKVGKLIAHIDAKGLRENTLIIFLSDNGWDQGPHDELGNNTDGPRGKMTLYEKGFRTPIIFNWPERIPAGKQHSVLVSAVDLFPTILDYTGAEKRLDRPGFDLRPLLEEKGKPWQRTFVIGGIEMPRPNAYRPKDRAPQTIKFPEPGYFYRDKKWRFIWNQGWGGAVELYDIKRDPGEQKNLAALHPKVTRRLTRQIKSWRGGMMVSMQGGAKGPKHAAKQNAILQRKIRAAKAEARRTGKPVPVPKLTE